MNMEYGQKRCSRCKTVYGASLTLWDEREVRVAYCDVCPANHVYAVCAKCADIDTVTQSGCPHCGTMMWKKSGLVPDTESGWESVGAARTMNPVFEVVKERISEQNPYNEPLQQTQTSGEKWYRGYRQFLNYALKATAITALTGVLQFFSTGETSDFTKYCYIIPAIISPVLVILYGARDVIESRDGREVVFGLAVASAILPFIIPFFVLKLIDKY